MATIKTIIDLIVMGHTDLPSVVAVVGTAEINSTVKRMKRVYREEHPDGQVGHLLSPCEIARAVYWWFEQPFANAQFCTFLEAEGNIPEEYLETGIFEKTAVSAEAIQALRVEVFDRVKPKVVEEVSEEMRLGLEVIAARVKSVKRRQDARGVLVVLDNQPIEVKEHRRIHKRHTNQFASCMLAELKVKFGTPARTKANELAMRRFVSQLMKQRGVRAVDQAKVIPYIVAAAFVPSDSEIGAASWLKTEEAINRLAGWTFDASA